MCANVNFVVCKRRRRKMGGKREKEEETPTYIQVHLYNLYKKERKRQKKETLNRTTVVTYRIRKRGSSQVTYAHVNANTYTKRNGYRY